MGGDRRKGGRLRAVGERDDRRGDGGRREEKREDKRTTCTQIKGSMVEYEYSSVGICAMNVWCLWTRVCVRERACVCQSLHLPCFV